MNGRMILLAAAITGLATPSALAIGAETNVGDTARVVEVRDNVHKVMGRCTYTAAIEGHYRATGTSNRVTDAVIAIDARLACANRIPVTTSLNIFYAVTTTQMLTQRVREVATLEYSPRRGTTCVAEPAMRAETTGPVFADLTMTCFASAAAPRMGR